MAIIILCLLVIAAGAAMGIFTSTLLLFGVAANVVFKVICAVCKVCWRSTRLVYRFLQWGLPASLRATYVSVRYLDDVILGAYAVSIFTILSLEAWYVEHEVRNRKH